MKSNNFKTMNFKKSMAMLIFAIVAVIFANAPRALAQTPTQTPPESNAQTINVPKSVYQNEETAAFVQNLLLRIEVEQKRAQANQKTADENATSRDQWKSLYFEEKARGEKLEAANLERQKEAQGNAIAVSTLRDQLKDANDDRASLQRDLERARSANKVWGAVGFGGGIAVCSAIKK